MPARQYYATTGYRYGFNGKENDNEVKGEGDQLDYGMRIYDPRLGRFLSVDPLIREYPDLTPYQFASNSPIANDDLDGKESRLKIFGNSWIPISVTMMVNGEDGAKQAAAEGKNPKWGYIKGSLRGPASAGIGALVGADIVFNQGRGTQFIISTYGLSRFWGAFYHNHSSSPEQEAERKQEFKEAMADVAVNIGLGKFVGVTTQLIVSSGKSIIKVFSSASIRTTQTTVNGVEEYVKQFAKAGKYNADPIDIVKMEDGIYSSVDHARLMAAEQLGYEVKAIAHDFNDPISLKDAKRFMPEGTPESELPKTWGDAIKQRVQNQGYKYSSQNPNGSFRQRPKIKS